ncbi:MAG: cytochrome c [Chloroflexota bacterium]
MNLIIEVEMKKVAVLVLFLVVPFLLIACGSIALDNQALSSEPFSGGMGMGRESGMGSRHHAQVPAEFADLTNPILSDEQSIARGGEIYALHCATCHGDGGMGDGPGGASLDPAPAPIAHSGQMLSDAYLFWRITEGGIPFDTAMIPYRDILDQNARWDVINYVRALGSGKVVPGEHMGGALFDPEVEAAQHAEMLALAVDQKVITQDEANTFNLVHDLVSDLRDEMNTPGRGMDEMMDELLDALQADGAVTKDQSETFLDVHDRLIEGGLMQ